jgi:S-adenosylmethionine/arginine decarboxylase-like enzyme
MAHVHFMLRAEIRRPLVSCARASRFLHEAIAACGMNIINGPHAVLGEIPGNEGVSATAILDFSHAALHEWPYRDPAVLQLDIYTCGAIEPSAELIAPLLAPLRPRRVQTMLVDRDCMDLWSISDEHAGPRI